MGMWRSCGTRPRSHLGRHHTAGLRDGLRGGNARCVTEHTSTACRTHTPTPCARLEARCGEEAHPAELLHGRASPIHLTHLYLLAQLLNTADNPGGSQRTVGLSHISHTHWTPPDHRYTFDSRVIRDNNLQVTQVTDLCRRRRDGGLSCVKVGNVDGRGGCVGNGRGRWKGWGPDMDAPLPSGSSPVPATTKSCHAGAHTRSRPRARRCSRRCRRSVRLPPRPFPRCYHRADLPSSLHAVPRHIATFHHIPSLPTAGFYCALPALPTETHMECRIIPRSS